MTAVIYWTVKLFALELSSTEVLKSKISTYSLELSSAEVLKSNNSNILTLFKCHIPFK